MVVGRGPSGTVASGSRCFLTACVVCVGVILSGGDVLVVRRPGISTGVGACAGHHCRLDVVESGRRGARLLIQTRVVCGLFFDFVLLRRFHDRVFDVAFHVVRLLKHPLICAEISSRCRRSRLVTVACLALNRSQNFFENFEFPLAKKMKTNATLLKTRPESFESGNYPSFLPRAFSPRTRNGI